MRRSLAGLVCAMAVTLASPAVAAAQAAATPTHGAQRTGINWHTHDTAVYVVSTINLLRTRRDKPLVPFLEHRLRVRRYDVYGDAVDTDLYYIELLKADGALVGSLAYTMGAVKPVSLSPVIDRMGISRASDPIAAEYRSDEKTLLGSFTSTLPQ